MKYTKKQFLSDVAKEAKLLKKNATKQELAKISFENFDPDDRYNCIYGQATGECRSKRAVELITSCCKRFVDNTRNKFNPKQGFKGFIINGEKSEAPESIIYLSAIEGYINLITAKNKNLIDFLKGERKDLVL